MIASALFCHYCSIRVVDYPSVLLHHNINDSLSMHLFHFYAFSIFFLFHSWCVSIHRLVKRLLYCLSLHLSSIAYETYVSTKSHKGNCAAECIFHSNFWIWPYFPHGKVINVLHRKIESVRVVFRDKEGGTTEVTVKVRKVGWQSSKIVRQTFHRPGLFW